MSKHSAIVGGSNAGRLVNCPGSHQAILALPEQLTDLPNEYAAEGSAMHEVMALLMSGRSAGGDCAPDRFIGQTFADRVLTREHVDTMIQPALDALNELEGRHHVGDFRVVGVELSVRFPGIPGAFGTCDLILQSDTHVILVDWKFGSGVGVRAEYSHPDGTIVNPQLLYYLAAALRTKPALFMRRKITVAIIQPRGIEPLTFTQVERREVRAFVEDVERAVVAAIGPNPPRRKGEWCRFAPCKTACPLWTGPLLELAALMGKPKPVPTGLADDGYGAYLARAKALVDAVAMMKSTIDEQMHTYLEQGGRIPGWRLKYKTKQRQWVDATTVVPALMRLGFDEEDIWDSKLTTFARADATAKRLGVKIPDELRVAPPSTETTLATTDDPAPVVEPRKLMDDFAASLRLLQQGTRS